MIRIFLLTIIVVFAGNNCFGNHVKGGNMKNNAEKQIWQVRGAGKWFPGTKESLSAVVAHDINSAKVEKIDGRIVGAIAPHAGYQYSGAVAGYTFKAIQENVKKYKVDTVVILGFTHGMQYPGVAVLESDIIRTPLGDTVVDGDAVSLLTGTGKRIFSDNRSHLMEHSAENEIPFVQYACPDAKLVVALIGDHDMKTVDELVKGLKALSEKKNIIVIASTDLLHDPDYDKVTVTDRKTLALISDGKANDLWAEWSYEHQICCGIAPVVSLIKYTKVQQNKIVGKILHYNNTGDDYPESRGQWVVGYGSVVFYVSG